jgi:hypothetical protein
MRITTDRVLTAGPEEAGREDSPGVLRRRASTHATQPNLQSIPEADR